MSFNISNMLDQATPYASLANSMSGKGELVHLEGWVPAGNEQAIQTHLQEKLTYPFLIDFRDPTVEELPDVPSLQKTNWLLNPFQALVGHCLPVRLVVGQILLRVPFRELGDSSGQGAPTADIGRDRHGIA